MEEASYEVSSGRCGHITGDIWDELNEGVRMEKDEHRAQERAIRVFILSDGCFRYQVRADCCVFSGKTT